MIRDIPRLVVVSGLALTGTTSLARLLAQALGWEAILVGERFRDYARTHSISLGAIPLQAHRDFDSLVLGELTNLKHAVLDGRYLGFFAKNFRDVMRIRLTADLSTRISRARQRSNHQVTVEQAQLSLVSRDKNEYDTFHSLYGDHDFLAEELFHVTLANDNDVSLDDLLARALPQCEGNL